MFSQKIVLPFIVIIFMMALPFTSIAQDSSGVELVHDYHTYMAYSHYAEVQGDYAYLATGETGLEILDISDPENPEWIGTYDTPGDSRYVKVVDDIAYVCDLQGGLRIVDVSDPRHPDEISFYSREWRGFREYQYRRYYDRMFVEIFSNFAFVGDMNRVGLWVIDVSDPADPRLAYDADVVYYGRLTQISRFCPIFMT